MMKSSPPPSKQLSKYAPLIHVMKVIHGYYSQFWTMWHILFSVTYPLLKIMFQVKPDKVNIIIGSGGKKVKSIIEETGVEAIETQDDGLVRIQTELVLWSSFCSRRFTWHDCILQIKITAKDLSSLEKSKAIIANLTMVPTVGDIYRSDVIGVFFKLYMILGILNIKWLDITDFWDWTNFHGNNPYHVLAESK